MRVGILPLAVLALVALLGAVGVAGRKLFETIRRGKAPSASSVAVLFLGLMLVDGAASIAVVVNAALGHSEAAKEAAKWYCAGLALVLVVIPVAAVVVAIRRSRSQTSGSPRHGAVP